MTKFIKSREILDSQCSKNRPDIIINIDDISYARNYAEGATTVFLKGGESIMIERIDLDCLL